MAFMIEKFEGKQGDPFGLQFDTQFEETDDLPQIRSILRVVYNLSRKGTFNLLSVVIGSILSILWGLTMALFQFFVIWYVLYSIKIQMFSGTSRVEQKKTIILLTWRYRGIIPGTKAAKLLFGPVAYVVGYIENLIYGPTLSNLASKGIKFNIFGKGKYNKNCKTGLEQVVISRDNYNDDHITQGGIVKIGPGSIGGASEQHKGSNDVPLAQDGIQLKLNQNINKDGEGPSYA